MTRRPDHADAARASLDDLAALPYIGGLLGLILLPKGCYDSIVDTSVRSGRSAASLVVWALVWSIAMVLGITLVSAFGYVVGLPGVPVIAGFLTPFGVGAIVGWRTPGLGGFGVGFVGLVIGGVLVGIVGCVVTVLARVFDPSSHWSPGEEAFLYIPLMTMLVPTLLGAQFGIGLLVATIVGRRRWPTPVSRG